MFSVRQIHIGGKEVLFETANVRYEPPSPPSTESSSTPETVWIDGGPLTGGTVFVMNNHGKTIARYDLGASPVPIIGDGLSDPRPRGLAQAA